MFGLTVVASLSSGHLVKGLISALAGLFLATIGLDPVTGDMRNTFDNPNLFNGLSLVPVLVGLFAVSQVLVTVEDVVRGVSLKESTVSKRGISLKDLTGNVVNFIRSSVIGTLIGIIPATGVSAASFLAYSEAKRFSKTPEMYGKGCVEGIAATESSNNVINGMKTSGKKRDNLGSIGKDFRRECNSIAESATKKEGNQPSFFVGG